MSRLLFVLLVIALTFAFVVCSAAAYVGFGVRRLGQEPGISVRSGSTTGPSVSGGGPGSGK